MTLPTDEQVRYDILIEAKAAVQAMRDMLKYTTENSVKMTEFTNQVLADSQRWGVSWQKALAVYKQLNAELAKQKQGTLFGQTGGQDLFAQSEKYLKALDDAGRLTQDLGNKSSHMGSQASSSFDRVFNSVNALRIALGAIISMILFQAIQAFQNFFKSAIDNAQQLEAALYRIHNAERILSGEGIEVSTQGLEEGIKRIKKLLPIFSKEDVTGLVGQVAITTKALGLNEKQIVDLSEAIAVLNVNSAKEETLQQTAQEVLSSLLTNNSKGVANLGIKLGDAALQAKGLELGFLQAGEAASALSDHEKSLTKLAIIIDGGKESIAGLNEYLNSNTAKLQINAAAWNDLKTSIGQFILPFIPAVTSGLSAITKLVDIGKAAFVTYSVAVITFYVILAKLVTFQIGSLKELNEVMIQTAEDAKRRLYPQFFPEGVPENSPEWLKRQASPYLTQSETPTGKMAGLPDAEQQAAENKAKAVADAEKKIQDAMKDSADKKLDIERDYGRKLEDIATKYSQKLEDIARHANEKREDALRNYNDKVEDINRDANQKMIDARNEERKKEIDREAQFQQRLKELREKFLFDLEDALRERDARAVLRLIRQYNMDKKNLEDKHKLDQQQAKKDLATKLQDIEYERQKKLEAARREYDDKLKEIQIGEARDRDEAALWRKRELEDAKIWHQRQLDEQRQYLQRKLRDIADALKAEFNMTSAGAQAMVGLLSSTLSAQAALWQQFQQGLMQPIAANGAITGGTGGSWSGWKTPSGQSWSGWTTPSGQSWSGWTAAEGGNFLATRPTKLTVGEKGAEMVSVTPLDKVGNNVNNTFGDKSALGTGGSVKIALELSPDLEARIVESSLDGMSVTLEKIVRSK